MILEILVEELSVCKLNNVTDINLNDEFVFIGKTDEEISLVCNTKSVPKDFIECDRGWRGFRIQGELDFSLIGILSKISKILADNKIGIFVISTFNTDYILVKKEKFDLSIQALSDEGYDFSP